MLRTPIEEVEMQATLGIKANLENTYRSHAHTQAGVLYNLLKTPSVKWTEWWLSKVPPRHTLGTATQEQVQDTEPSSKATVTLL